MVSKSRATRIAERIRQDLSEILILKSADPRLAGISVTDVTVDRELAFADVFVCALEASNRIAEILAALDHAHGYFRSELAKRLDLRVFPRLRFHWDPTFERAEVIEHLISTLHKEDVENQPIVKAGSAQDQDDTESKPT
jgi:ribosome-binding factor A